MHLFPEANAHTLAWKESCKEDGSGMLRIGRCPAWLSFLCIYEHPAPRFSWAPLGDHIRKARNTRGADHHSLAIETR